MGWWSRWFGPKKAAAAVPGEILAVPGTPFAVPIGRGLRATEDGLVIALPVTVFGEGPLGDTFSADAEAEISIPERSDVFYVRLRAGMVIRVMAAEEACEGMVIAEDGRVRRIEVL